KIFRGEAECAIGGRNEIRGVVAENEHATSPIPLDATKRRRFPLFLPQPSKPLLHRHPLLVLDTNPGSYLGFAHSSKRKGASGGQGCDAITQDCRRWLSRPRNDLIIDSSSQTNATNS